MLLATAGGGARHGQPGGGGQGRLRRAGVPGPERAGSRHDEAGGQDAGRPRRSRTPRKARGGLDLYVEKRKLDNPLKVTARKVTEVVTQGHLDRRRPPARVSSRSSRCRWGRCPRTPTRSRSRRCRRTRAARLSARSSAVSRAGGAGAPGAPSRSWSTAGATTTSTRRPFAGSDADAESASGVTVEGTPPARTTSTRPTR